MWDSNAYTESIGWCLTFCEQMSVFKKSHGLLERPEWGENLREGHPCECPVLPIALHKADLPFTPDSVEKVALALRVKH